MLEPQDETRNRLAALLLAATPALAEPTARVSGGDIAVRTGPGHGYRTIGRLSDGAEVTLEYCTRGDHVKWCFVTGTGWVDAGYLVGSAAKIGATPFEFLVDPFGDDDDE